MLTRPMQRKTMLPIAALRCARFWIPMWCLLLVCMSFGARAATDLCTFTDHCGRIERSLEKAMPCGSFTTMLGMACIAEVALGVAPLEADVPHFPEPDLRIPAAPCERLERPPRLLLV